MHGSKNCETTTLGLGAGGKQQASIKSSMRYLFLEICILQLTKKVSNTATDFFLGNRRYLVDYRKYEILLGMKLIKEPVTVR